MSVSAALEPSAVALAAAFAIDLAFGEPPNRAHPVVWMGASAALLERSAPKIGRLRQLAFGLFIAAAVPTAFAAAGGAILGFVDRWALPALLLEAALLKTTFSVKALGDAASRVRSALREGSVAEARFHLRALCSRDAASLDEPDLVGATIESVAENASDSFVAPVFYYALGGLPAALFYRAANTLDAMIGYHGRFEYLGKAAARLDDLLNLVPARLTAALLLASGALGSADGRRGWMILRRDRSRTESPNAGWPMAAMAGLLGVELEKKDHYRLGDPVKPLTVGKIDEAWRLVRVCTVLALGAFLAVLLLRGAYDL